MTAVLVFSKRFGETVRRERREEWVESNNKLRVKEEKGMLQQHYDNKEHFLE